jgi:hypothetical protein
MCGSIIEHCQHDLAGRGLDPLKADGERTGSCLLQRPRDLGGFADVYGTAPQRQRGSGGENYCTQTVVHFSFSLMSACSSRTLRNPLCPR